MALSHVMELTGFGGRWEIVHHKPMVVLEVAHNGEGIAQMVAHLSRIQYNRLHIVLGMVKDKEPAKVLELLPKNALYYFTQAAIPRALDAATLREKAAVYSLKGNDFPEVNMALEDALQHAGKNDLVIVCGSIFLVAEVNRQLVSQFA
jgi:dihydrofolate synthase/folylpolyglutamate synthase